MSGPSFEGPIEGHNILAGVSVSAGTVNANFHCPHARVREDKEDDKTNDFSLALDLSEVTETTHFVARKEELAQMHKILGNTPARRTAILHGLGGMGKTQLAIAYIKHHYTDYSAVIWLNAKDETTLKHSFVRVAECIVRQYPSLIYIKNAVENRDLDELVQAVKRWLDEPRNNQWLVVYDNYDDPKLGDRRGKASRSGLDEGNTTEGNTTEVEIAVPKAFDIRPFFPTTFHGAIIITTRSSTVKIGQLIHLQKLKDIKDSLEILASTSHRQNAYHDDAAAKLAWRLDGLPLALSTAGAYLDQVTTSWEEYLELYQESWLRLQRASPQLLSYESRAMYSTWDISYKRIEQENEAAAMLLKLWAYFDNEDLWYELLRRGGSHTNGWLKELTQDRLCFDQTMRVLCSHGLVEADSRGYSIHRCIHSWIIYALNPKTHVEMAWLAMGCVASHVPDNSEPEYWLVQRRLLQHADRCFNLMALGLELQEGYEWITHSLGSLFADQGRLSDAEVMYERALRGYEKAWGPEHTSTLATVNNLGNLYKGQGRLGDAETMYERALRGYEKALGNPIVETYPLALNSMENLGNLLHKLNRAGEARLYYTRAEAGLRTVHGSQSERYQKVVSKLQLGAKSDSSFSKPFQQFKYADWLARLSNWVFPRDKP